MFDVKKYDLARSIALKNRLRVVFKADTTIEQIREIVEKSQGHLFHLFKESDSDGLDNFVAYINFPLELSLFDCASDLRVERVKKIS